MKYYLTAFLTMILVGCASTPVPVVPKFPTVADPSMMTPCPDLGTVAEDTTKLSDIIGTVTTNYASYYDCKANVSNWIEWYNTQKKIYESIK